MPPTPKPAQGLPVHPELRPWHVIQIVRLLDEAVTNTVKHANAKRITVRIETFAGADGLDRGCITVEDDGDRTLDAASAQEFQPVSAPAARFLQYRLTFNSNGGGKRSAVVDDVDVSYQEPNLPPQIKSVKIATTAKALGLARFDLKYSAGTLAHDKLMRCIELYGTSEPYLPILEAMQRLGAEIGVDKLAIYLRSFAPTWLAQMPWLWDQGKPPGDTAGAWLIEPAAT